MNGNEHIDEILNLNIDDLDIEELERRIELAMATPMLSEPCGCNAPCPNLTCCTHS